MDCHLPPIAFPETMKEKRYVPDSWIPHELPALIAIAEWDEATTSTNVLRLEKLTELMKREPKDMARVAKAVGRLVEAGYVNAQSLNYMGAAYVDYMIRGLTPLGLEAVGAWPRLSDDLVDIFLRALESQAESLDHTAPEEASKVRAFGKFLGGQGLDVAKTVIAAVISHQMTGN
jgi:hypothetical protein